MSSFGPTRQAPPRDVEPYLEPPRPRGWVLPLAVLVAVVVGALSVPVLMNVLPNLMADDSASVQLDAAASPTSRPGASGQGSGQASEPVDPPSVALVDPVSLRPQSSVLLASPPAPGSMTRAAATSAAPSASASVDLAGRTAQAEPATGPAGRVVTVSGQCLAGTDTTVRVGTAAKGQVNADGTFSTQLAVGSGGRVGQVVGVPVQCTSATGAVVRLSATYTVTIVVTMPASVGQVGGLDASLEGSPGAQIVSVGGGGFMPGTPVIVQLRNLDEPGKVGVQHRLLSREDGSISASGLAVPGTGQVLVVAAGVDAGEAQHVITATVTVPAQG